MGFSRQEYWSGLPGPPPGDLLDPGLEPTSLMSPALVGGFFTTSATWEVRPGPKTKSFWFREMILSLALSLGDVRQRMKTGFPKRFVLQW